MCRRSSHILIRGLSSPDAPTTDHPHDGPRRFAASDQRLSAFPDGAAPHDVAQVWGNMVSID